MTPHELPEPVRNVETSADAGSGDRAPLARQFRGSDRVATVDAKKPLGVGARNLSRRPRRVDDDCLPLALQEERDEVSSAETDPRPAFRLPVDEALLARECGDDGTTVFRPRTDNADVQFLVERVLPDVEVRSRRRDQENLVEEVLAGRSSPKAHDPKRRPG